MLERRTVEWFRGIGYHAERVIRRGRLGTRDIFGCVDVLAANAEGPVMIQVTTKKGASHRRGKIRAARLPWPVRLVIWQKCKNRWAFQSEEIIAISCSDDMVNADEAGASNTGLVLTETALRRRAR